MTRALLLLPLIVLAAPGQGAQQREIFRAEVQGVSVTVSVREARRPVTGLTAADFELRDNGVPQQISSLSVESTPVDVTVLLDTSASVSGAMLTGFLRDVRAMDSLLATGDRMRLLTFATAVHEAYPMRPSGGAVTPESMSPAGATAFYHALLCAMMTGPNPERPHLIFALSDGDDNLSLLDGADVREVARRSESVLSIFLRGTRGLSHPHIGWLAFRGPGPLTDMREAAALTGGLLREQKDQASSIDMFTEALGEFKSSYVLRYVPSGVAPRGWHDLTVSVRGRHHDVRARRGYFS